MGTSGWATFTLEHLMDTTIATLCNDLTRKYATVHVNFALSRGKNVLVPSQRKKGFHAAEFHRGSTSLVVTLSKLVIRADDDPVLYGTVVHVDGASPSAPNLLEENPVVAERFAALSKLRDLGVVSEKDFLHYEAQILAQV